MYYTIICLTDILLKTIQSNVSITKIVNRLQLHNYLIQKNTTYKDNTVDNIREQTTTCHLGKICLSSANP